MNISEIEFTSADLDILFARWLAGQLKDFEREDLQKVLTYNTKLREQLCDWLRALREPTSVSYR